MGGAARSPAPARSLSARAVRGGLIGLAMALALGGRAVLAAEPVDLIGTWHVTVHYRDSASPNPEAERWEDKVWTFEKKGSRLLWTEYPIVVFDDRDGRFEAVAGNPRSRTLAFWEPNASQRAQIEEGPRVNSRGSKSKSLRGSLESGYRSSSQMRGVSATTIGYHEDWSIDDPAALPVFTRDDVLGMGRTRKAGGEEQNVEGRTRYRTVAVEGDARLLQGDYVRDGTRKGSFRMLRAGDVQQLKSDGRTPNEKAFERAREQFIQNEIERRRGEIQAELGDPNSEEAQQVRELLGEERIAEISAPYRARIEDGDVEAARELREAIAEAARKELEADFMRRLESGDPEAMRQLREYQRNQRDRR